MLLAGLLLVRAVFHCISRLECKCTGNIRKPSQPQPHGGAMQESMRNSAGDGGAAAPPSTLQVCQRHFEAAMRRVAPSVSRKDQRVYDQLRRSLRSTRGHLDATVSVTTRLVRPFTFLSLVRVKTDGGVQVTQPLELTDAVPGACDAAHEADVDKPSALAEQEPKPDPGTANSDQPNASVNT